MKIGRIILLVVVVLTAVGAGVLIGTWDSGPDTVNVTVTYDDGVNSVNGTGEYLDGTDVILSVNLKEGCVIEGWYDAEFKLVSTTDSLKVKATNTNYIVRTSSQIVVELTGDYGVISTTGAGTYMTNDVLKLKCQLKSGFDFVGWYDDNGNILSDSKDAEIKTSIFKTKNITIVAKSFCDKKVQLRITKDSGTESVEGAGTYNLGQPVELKATPVEGYHIQGWYCKNEKIGEGESITIYAENKTISVKTEHNPQIKIILHGDAGVDKTYTDDVLYEGTWVSFGAWMKPGYSFDGWYDKNNKLMFEWQWTDVLAEENIEVYAKTVPEYTVHILSMPGVDTTGKMTFYDREDSYLYYDDCANRCFEGWYDLDGNLLSRQTFYDTDDYDGVYIAKTNIDDYSGNNILKIDNYPKWYDEYSYCIILDSHTKKYVDSFKYKDCPDLRLKDGTYDICYYNGFFDRGEEHKVITKTFGTSKVYDFHWIFNGDDYGCSWEIDNATFDYYHDKKIFHNSYGINLKYLCDYKDQYIVKMANFLMKNSEGMNQRDRANFVLKFVQHSTQYELDSDYNGEEDYAKHPVMTLLEGRGDCEDTAILYVTLMKAIGYDVALLDYTGEEYTYNAHEAAGVRIDELMYGTYYEYNGGRYYYCETTSNTMNVGDPWDDYTNTHIIPI